MSEESSEGDGFNKVGGYKAPYDMNDGIVALFDSFMIRNDFEDALSVICYSIDINPAPIVISEIIFKIMMTCDSNLAYEASIYLEGALQRMPTDDHHKNIFIEGLKDCTGSFKDVWDAFSHFVLSCLHHREISDGYISSQEFVKSENCEYLVDIYTKVFLSYPSSSTIFGCHTEENFSALMRWINVYYKCNVQMDEVLQSLHLLLDHVIECEISTNLAVPKFLAFNTAPLSQYIVIILSNCKDALANSENQQRFFNNVESPLLIAKICQYILEDMINKESVHQSSVLTLKSIVEDYFFHQPKQTNPKQVSMDSPKKPNRGKTTRKCSKDCISASIKSGTCKGDTIFHKRCRTSKFGDLLESLYNDESRDINVKNEIGNTPLHEACLAGSYHCCKFLIEESGARKVDFKATDNKGRTPLHFAVYKGELDVVKLLLARGGSELAKCCDNDGNKPIDYSKSQEMRDLVQSYEKLEPNEDKSKESSSSAQQKPPNLKNSQNYPIYLQTLRRLITNYCEIYDIPKDTADVKILSHSNKECSHYKVSAEETLCVDDSSALETFVESIDKLCACVLCDSTGVSIAKQLQSLKILTASFK